MPSIPLLLLPALAAALLALPLAPVCLGLISGKPARRSFAFNLCGFLGVMLTVLLLPASGFAAEDAAALAAASSGAGMGYIAAALATGMSAIGSGIAVASAAPAAIGATSEDPKSFGKALIFVVLGEGIAIYGLLISILIINSLG